MKAKRFPAAAGIILAALFTGALLTACPGQDSSGTAEYGITAVVSGTGDGEVTAGPAKAAEGAAVTLTTAPAALSVLASIRAETTAGIPITLSGSGNTYTFIMPASDVIINAVFDVISASAYTVTIGTKTHGNAAAVPSSSILPGTTVTVTVTPDAGYKSHPGSLTISGGVIPVAGNANQWTFVMPAANVTIDVGCVLETAMVYTIGVTQPAGPASGTIAVNPASSIAAGTITITVTPADGYRLKTGGKPQVSGVAAASVTAGAAGQWTFTMPENNITVTAGDALEEIPAYAVAKTDPAYGTIAVSSAAAKEGETVTITLAVTNTADYRFKKDGKPVVTGSDSGDITVTRVPDTNTWTFTMPARDVTVTEGDAFRVIPEHTVTLSNNAFKGNLAIVSGVSDNGKAKEGATVTVQASALPGYRLRTNYPRVTDNNTIATTVTPVSAGTWSFTMPGSEDVTYVTSVTVTAKYDNAGAVYTVYGDGAIGGYFAQYNPGGVTLNSERDGRESDSDPDDAAIKIVRASGEYNLSIYGATVDGVQNKIDLNTVDALSFWVRSDTAGAVIDFVRLGTGDYQITYKGEADTGLVVGTTWQQVIVPIPTRQAAEVANAFQFYIGQASSGIGKTFWLDDIEFITATVALDSIALPASDPGPIGAPPAKTDADTLTNGMSAVYKVDTSNTVTLYKGNIAFDKWYTPITYAAPAGATVVDGTGAADANGSYIKPTTAGGSLTLTVTFGGKTTNARTVSVDNLAYLMIEDFEGSTPSTTSSNADSFFNSSADGGVTIGWKYNQAENPSTSWGSAGHDGYGVRLGYSNGTGSPATMSKQVTRKKPGISLTGFTKITFWILHKEWVSGAYGSGTGGTFTFIIDNGAGTEYRQDFTITTANTWQKIELPISGFIQSGTANVHPGAAISLWRLGFGVTQAMGTCSTFLDTVMAE
ncbi:hypothetical protein AGMMS50267_00680 [Spirochaetia bacterium]|nr:hypothetical protein AGMMS50267_00680 [Spirochaetia bacterium]